MKNFFLSLVLVSLANFCFAQNDLVVKSSEKGLYLEHKVTPKENFYSIGRLYNAPPKGIAAFNDLDMNKGLNLGQVIKIPLVAPGFSQTANEGTPVYYKVGEKDGLMKVSTVNNKVPLENLRRWNNLKNDNINFGDKLIVGYIVSGQLPVVAKQEPPKVEQKKEPIVEKKDVVANKKEESVLDIPPGPIKKVVVPEKKEPVVEKKEESVLDIPPGPIKKVVVPEKPEQTDNRMASPNASVNTVIVDNNKPVLNDGYFKPYFDQQIKTSPVSRNQTLTSGIFKTASGWQDAKYYMLIDGVQPGTIIKVINPSNNKMVYAKVLGEMQGIRQNEGYNIRLSNAAASALDISETDKFIVKVSY